MDWFTWGIVSSFTVPVLSVVTFIIGHYYKVKIEKSVQHNMDRRLEDLRSEVRKNEEVLRADLNEKSQSIIALRNVALSTLSTRQVAIEQRRIQAIEKVWASAVDYSRLKMAAAMVGSMNIDAVLNGAAQQDDQGFKLRELGGEFWNASGLTEAKPALSANIERPFLTPIVWARYSAYCAVLGHAVAILAAMRTGADPKLLAEPTSMLNLVKSALPHQAGLVDKFGVACLNYLVEELEEALLRELQNSLQNQEADVAQIEQAAAILKAVEVLTREDKNSLHHMAPDAAGLAKVRT